MNVNKEEFESVLLAHNFTKEFARLTVQYAESYCSADQQAADSPNVDAQVVECVNRGL